MQGGFLFGRDRSRRQELRRLVTEEKYDAIAAAVEGNPAVARELVELVADQADDVGENASHAIGLLGSNEDRAPQAIQEISPRLDQPPVAGPLLELV